MEKNKCLICRAIIPADHELCKTCAEIMEENAEIINAMRHCLPVEHKGIKYGCISAFTIRVRASHLNSLRRKKYVLQVELLSKNSSLTIADPKEINVLKEFEK